MANELAPSQTQSLAANPSASSSNNTQALQAGVSNIQGMLLNNRRLLLLIASILMLAGFISLLFWSAEAPYRPLFSNIDEKEAAAIIELLQKEKVPYRLEGRGTVLVPSDQVYALRLKLAGQDKLPGNKTGYELFDNSSQLGVSDFVQNVNLQRALQGELARTIEILPQVSVARVHLVLPKESAFINRKKKASASVMLQLAGSSRISKQSILAIQNLIAAGVPELEREAVTVVDSSGNLLTTKGESTATSAVQTHQEYQVTFERRMEERLTRMLEQIVGAGQAVVRVAAEINREHVEQNNQRFNPDESVLRSERVTDENRKASEGSRAIGVPGAASNSPDKSANAQAQQPLEEAGRKEYIRSYEISSTNEKRIIPFGKVEKLSVAVLVGGTVRTENDVSTVIPRSQEELKSIRGLVERTMGFNEDRGDSLEVQSLSLVDLSSNADTAAMQEVETKAFNLELARYGVAALALLLLAWFVLRPLGKRFISQESASATVNAGGNMAALNQPAGAVEAALNAMQMQAIESGDLEQQALQGAAREMISQDAKTAARIIQQWTQQA